MVGSGSMVVESGPVGVFGGVTRETKVEPGGSQLKDIPSVSLNLFRDTESEILLATGHISTNYQCTLSSFFESKTFIALGSGFV